MSLVVARRFGDEIRIVCDGKITDINEIKRGPIYANLKAVVIDKDNCVCYAGILNIALDAIRHIIKTNISNYDSIKDYLFTIHRQNDNKTDFIVASNQRADCLCKISDGAISDNITVGWIGAQEAFNEFQINFNKDVSGNIETEEKLSIYSKMIMAMDKLVREGKCESVGDFSIGLRSGPAGFNYLCSGSTAFVRQVIPPNKLTKLRFGSAKEGGYSYTILTPEEEGIGAIGIHFFQGDLGVLFYPKISDSALIYSDVDHALFSKKVKEDYGFSLTGLVIS